MNEGSVVGVRVCITVPKVLGRTCNPFDCFTVHSNDLVVASILTIDMLHFGVTWFCVLCDIALLVSFANGLAQPLRVGEAAEMSNGSVIQVIPDGQVGTISLAGHFTFHL